MKGDRGFMHYQLAVCPACAKPHVKRSWRPLRKSRGVCYDCGEPIYYTRVTWGVYKKFMQMSRVELTLQT